MRRSGYFRFSFLAMCALVPLASSGFAQEAAPTEPNIHVHVDRVNVGVVVTDSRGQFVQGLQRGDFQLFDDGVEQPITDFLSIDEPAQVLLLVEAGPAVYFLQGGHLHAVQVLLDGLARGDRVAIARYDERAGLVQDFIGDKRVASAALDQLQFNLGYGQLNLASSLLTVLDQLVRIPGKKSLVLLTTGVDTSPAPVVQSLLARLRTTDVRVLTVSLVGQTPGPSPAEAKSSQKNQIVDAKAQFVMQGLAQANQELKAIAEANSSRAYFPTSTKDFAEVFGEISQLIRHEYSLGFSPPVRDAKIHAIQVTVGGSQPVSANSSSRSAYRIDHRKAYMAPSAPDE